MAEQIAVIGAGTMGSGIAQLGAQAGYETFVHDPVPGAAARGIEGARTGIGKLVEKGRLEGDAAEIGGRLREAASLDDLKDCTLIIEAAPERLELKHELVTQLSGIAPQAVFASNTSSIPITAIARAAADPGLVVGMHFFNPAPLMRLVEVIAGVASSEEALALARTVGERMGRRVIDATDGPGFLVNRCNRPFLLEALRLLELRYADIPTIDRIVRAAGFRMGPFELSDLVGLDTGFAVSESFHELSFGEPRWKPSPLMAQRVAAGHLGRKTGRGWYDHSEPRPEDPDAAGGIEAGGGDGRLVVIAGDFTIADELRVRAEDAGWQVAEEAGDEVPHLIVVAGFVDHDAAPLQGAPQALLIADGSLHTLDPGGSAVGFHALPPAGLVELTRGAGTSDLAHARATEFFHSLGLPTVEVGDAAGLVLGRIVCQLVNECAFALQEGVTEDPADVDAGMKLGLNQPRGPLEWADMIGLDHVVSVLDGLRAETGEERYRAAPLLRRMVSEAATFHADE